MKRRTAQRALLLSATVVEGGDAVTGSDTPDAQTLVDALNLDLSPADVHEPAADPEPAPPKKKPLGKPAKGGLRFKVTTDPSGQHTIDVRHGSDREFVARDFDHLALDLADLAAGEEAKWIQVAKLGAWEGHPSGPFALTEQHFDEMIANFNDAAVSGGKTVFDYEHQSEQDPPVEAPASGWIRGLKKMGDGASRCLMALVKWTKRARAQILGDEYADVSPAVRFNSRHPVTGARIGTRLSSAALTNQPFLRGMRPVAAKDAPRGALAKPFVSTGDMLAKARVALGAHAFAMPHELKASVASLRNHYEAADDAMGVNSLGVDLGGYTPSLMAMGSSLGGPETMGDLLDALEARIDAAIAEHNLERHDGANMHDQPGRTVAATATATSRDQESNMPMPKDEKELEVLLRAAGEKAAKDATKALDATNAELTLQLKAATATNDKIAADVKALKDAQEKREADAVQVDVDRAIADYGAERNISAKDRPELVKVREQLPDSFAKLYPLKATEDREDSARRAQVFTGRGGQVADPPRRLGDEAEGGGEGAPVVERRSKDDDLDEVQLRVKYQEKGMNLTDACVKAHEVVMARSGGAAKPQGTEPRALVAFKGGRR